MKPKWTRTVPSIADSNETMQKRTDWCCRHPCRCTRQQKIGTRSCKQVNQSSVDIRGFPIYISQRQRASVAVVRHSTSFQAKEQSRHGCWGSRRCGGRMFVIDHPDRAKVFRFRPWPLKKRKEYDDGNERRRWKRFGSVRFGAIRPSCDWYNSSVAV